MTTAAIKAHDPGIKFNDRGFTDLGEVTAPRIEHHRGGAVVTFWLPADVNVTPGAAALRLTGDSVNFPGSQNVEFFPLADLTIIPAQVDGMPALLVVAVCSQTERPPHGLYHAESYILSGEWKVAA